MEVRGEVDLGADARPMLIRHTRLALIWEVTAVLEDWMTRQYRDVAGTPEETRRFRCRVRGPLPGQPSEKGDFVLVVRRYGDRAGWWITPATED
jgi:hypothetical protein